MRYFAHALLALLLLAPLTLLQTTHAAAEEAAFAHRGIEQDAKRYETYLKGNWQTGGRPGSDLRPEGNRLLASDARAASLTERNRSSSELISGTITRGSAYCPRALAASARTIGPAPPGSPGLSGSADPLLRAEAANAPGQYAEPRVIVPLVSALDDRFLSVNEASRPSTVTLTPAALGPEREAGF